MAPLSVDIAGVDWDAWKCGSRFGEGDIVLWLVVVMLRGFVAVVARGSLPSNRVEPAVCGQPWRPDERRSSAKSHVISHRTFEVRTSSR